MNRNSSLVVGLVVAVVVIAAGVVLMRSSAPVRDDANLSVVTSFYPLYFLAAEIGGDKATVTALVPPGAEPHEYEPTPRDIARIESADVLVLNGAGLEGWGDDIAANIQSHVTVVRASDGIATRHMVHAHDDGDVHDTEEEREVTDPHVWLSPVLAQKMVDAITAGYIQADGANAAYYQERAQGVKAQLNALDAEYRQRLTSCVRRDIVTSHAAFGYLADAYNLTQIPIVGISTEEEPSVQHLAEIADFAKEHGVTTIFFESLLSPKLAQTIAAEVGAQTRVLNPIEGLTAHELTAGKTYITEMRENLNQLTIALQCQ